MKQQNLDDSTSVHGMVYWIFSVHCWDVLLRKKKKNPFKIILFTDNVPGHSRDESYTAFMPANTTSILQPMDQGEILAFKSYDLRKSFDGSGLSK